MITKEDARYLTDEELKICSAEYVRRKRGGKQEVKPSDLQDLKPEQSKELDIF